MKEIKYSLSIKDYRTGDEKIKEGVLKNANDWCLLRKQMYKEFDNSVHATIIYCDVVASDGYLLSMFCIGGLSDTCIFHVYPYINPEKRICCSIDGYGRFIKGVIEEKPYLN